MNAVAAILFVGTFLVVVVRQLLGRGPALWMVFGAGALLTVLTGVLPLGSAGATLVASLPVLIFLFALFVFASALERSGSFEHLARWILGRAEAAVDLPLFVFIGFGALSSFLLNDALVLVGVPLFLAVSRELSSDPKPLLLVLAYSVTVGSVLTPLGNPQNLLVALSSGMAAPVALFLRYLLLPTALNLLLGGLYLRWTLGPKFDRGAAGGAGFPRMKLFPEGDWGARLRRHPVIAVFPATMILLVGSDLYSSLTNLASLPVYEVALGGALLLLALTGGRATVLRRVDWSILALFAGLFVVVAGAEVSGLLGGLNDLLPAPPAAGESVAALAAIIAPSLLGPQLVSNVPWVALQIPVFHLLGYGAATPLAWIALAAGATLAGNVTLLGAASNLIVVERAESAGVRIHLSEFVRHGLPLTAITTTVLLVCLAAGL